MTDERVVPVRVEGRWLSGHGAGCRTCGAYTQGTYGELREWFLDHTHDPIHDVTERALSGVAWVPVEDVLYLLDLLDSAHDAGTPDVATP